MKRFLTTMILVLALVAVQLGLPEPAWALYRVQYGDTISVTVKDAPQYSTAPNIRPDGAITVPYLGDIEVNGLTSTQVADRIAKALGQFIRNPQVTVAVTGFRGRVVGVFGKVISPGPVTIPPTPVNPTLLDAIAGAGGFSPRSNQNEVMVIRGVGAESERFVVDVEKMIKTGDFTTNMVIQDQDKVIVPEVWYPDVAQIVAVIGTTASVITMLAVIANAYNNASR